MTALLSEKQRQSDSQHDPVKEAKLLKKVEEAKKALADAQPHFNDMVTFLELQGTEVDLEATMEKLVTCADGLQAELRQASADEARRVGVKQLN